MGLRPARYSVHLFGAHGFPRCPSWRRGNADEDEDNEQEVREEVVKEDEKGGGYGKRCHDRASENDALPECWSHPLPRGSSKTSAWSKRSPQAFSRASPFVFDSSFSFASARSPRGRHCRGSSARSSERGSKVGGTPGLVQLLLRFVEGALSRRAP